MKHLLSAKILTKRHQGCMKMPEIYTQTILERSPAVLLSSPNGCTKVMLRKVWDHTRYVYITKKNYHREHAFTGERSHHPFTLLVKNSLMRRRTLSLWIQKTLSVGVKDDLNENRESYLSLIRIQRWSNRYKNDLFEGEVTM